VFPSSTCWTGKVYIAYGGLLGDCGRYFGSVVALTGVVAVSGA
jgi:hypothetical protein